MQISYKLTFSYPNNFSYQEPAVMLNSYMVYDQSWVGGAPIQEG